MYSNNMQKDNSGIIVRNSKSQTRESILEMIAHAKIGDSLLTVRNMMVKFGVSQSVIDTVLGELESNGYIERKRGSGIYIRKTGHKYSINQNLISVQIQEFASPFNRFFLEGIRSEALKNGFDLILNVQNIRREKEFTEERSSLPSGTIIMSKSWLINDVNYLDYLKKLQKRMNDAPFVSIDFALPGIKSDLVVCDNIAAGKEGIRLLEKKGCRSVLVFTLVENIICAQRAEGIEQYLKESKNSLEIRYHGITNIQTSYRTRYREILSESGYDGIFCLVPHQIGQIVLESLICGKKPGKDVLIASIVDVETAEIYRDEVICLIKPWQEMGRSSFEIIHGRLEGRIKGASILKKLKVNFQEPVKSFTGNN